MVCRVIQMIDDNKEQLRNLFRNYNIMDVQPAVSGKVPDDFSTLQVSDARTDTQPLMSEVLKKKTLKRPKCNEACDVITDFPIINNTLLRF